MASDDAARSGIGGMRNIPGAAIYTHGTNAGDRLVQLHACTEYARQHGLVVIQGAVGQYQDAVTGSDEVFDRPEFARLFRGIYSGAFSDIIVAIRQVLFRDPDDLRGFMGVLKQFGITLHITSS